MNPRQRERRRSSLVGWILPLLSCAATPPAPIPSAEAPAAEAAPQSPIDSLRWLAGSWVSADPTGPRTIEHWLAPEGGTMLGVNRTVANGRTVFFEYLRLEIDVDGQLVYLASPKGRDPPTRFVRTDQGPEWIAFENPTHDFPQRIEYRRTGTELTMTISGQEQGQPKSSQWSMRRLED